MKFGSRHYFIQEATTGYGQHDLVWFVVVKDKTEPIGFVQFLLRPEFKPGIIRVKNLMLLPKAQHRGIGNLLISSIFAIFRSAEIKKIMLSTLIVNDQAIAAYNSYGFRQQGQKNMDKEKSDGLDQYEVILEYDANQSDILQHESQKLR